MSKRRRILVVAGSLLLAGGFLACWNARRRGGAPVVLFFAGYTNKEMPVHPAKLTLRQGVVSFHPITIPVALLVATNQGFVPVQLWPTARLESCTRTGFVPTWGTGFPRLLKPGGSLTIEVWPFDFGADWWTEVAYQRHGLLERIYGWAWNLGNSNAQRTMSRLLGAPAMLWAESGWITNRPPPIQALPSDLPPTRHYHITAPPQGGPIELE